MKKPAETEFEAADWQSVGLRLLVFARYWAKAHYGWFEGSPTPGGYTPEDVVCEVYAAFQRGLTDSPQGEGSEESIRHFNGNEEMWIQLKRAVKSVLWNIHTLQKFKAEDLEGPEFFDPITDERPSPEEALRSSEFCERLFEATCGEKLLRRFTAIIIDQIAKLMPQTPRNTALMPEIESVLQPYENLTFEEATQRAIAVLLTRPDIYDSWWRVARTKIL